MEKGSASYARTCEGYTLGDALGDVKGDTNNWQHTKRGEGLRTGRS